MTNKFASKTFTPTVQGSGGDHSNIDWEGLNKHVAESVQGACGCEEGTAAGVIGIISGIVDVGKHQDPERVEPMDEGDAATKEWKQRMVDNKKATVDEDGNFHFQAAPCQEVCFYVDFPNITVDKGQFFGDSNPAPYRVLLGGVFDRKPAQLTKVQGYKNSNNEWVFGDKNRATKLAKAAKVSGIKDGFAQSRLLELIGKPVQFSLEVYINSAGYLQEKVLQPSPLMAGIPVPEYDENLLFYVGMNEDNEDAYLKVLTKPVKGYIEGALDYEGSKLQEQLEAAGQGGDDKPSEKPVDGVKEESNPTGGGSAVGDYNEPPMDFDEDDIIPF